MFFDTLQFVHSLCGHAIVGMIVDDILKESIDLISVFSSRFCKR
jgi:hypothetical protein